MSKESNLKDKFKFEDIECAIIWNLPDSIFKKLSRLKVIFSLHSEL